jgi:nucleoside-diphosphate-sugar epimerase
MYEAESMVAGFAGTLPAAIARLSTIVGDSLGVVRKQNCVHHLLRLFPRSPLQQAPCEPKALVDLISSDWAADALAWLFLNRFQSGGVWHISDGPTAAFTMEEMLAETHRLFAHHPKAQRWLPIEVPRMVSLSEYEEFVERAESSGSHLTAELLRSVSYFLPHLGIAQTFENHRTRALLAPSRLEPPPVGSFTPMWFAGAWIPTGAANDSTLDGLGLLGGVVPAVIVGSSLSGRVSS